MSLRKLDFLDRVLGEIDNAIRVLAAPSRAARAAPCPAGGEFGPGSDGAAESIRLMRVNHAGEVAAQALYQGQALTARTGTVAAAMQKAAAEEIDHLAWCEARLAELGGRTSLLNPLWYAGSWCVGALAGACGDPVSLGFVHETETQVESHLQDHLGRLPPEDFASRAILEQMKQDEIQHGASAMALGGRPLPAPLKRAMRLASRLMTRGSLWV